MQPDGKSGGASTIISKAKSEYRVPLRKEFYAGRDIDPETGKKIYRYDTANATYIDKKTGQVKERTTKSTKMAETDDAMTLVSPNRHPMEIAYAEHANRMKALGNQARKEYMATEVGKRSPSAAKEYKEEVDSLNNKLNIALQNAPRERQAQLMANKKVESAKRENPDMTKDELKRLKGQALGAMRAKYGAKKVRIDITDREWEAIQANAISSNKMAQIFDNTDLDALKKRATPRPTKSISSSREATIKSMLARGYTYSQIADKTGVSMSTISTIANS